MENLPPELAGEIVDASAGPATQLERAQDLRQLEVILADVCEGVSTLTRRIIRMRWNEGRSVPDIAAALDLSEEAVWARLRRARAKVKDRLSRRGWDFGQED